MAADGSARFGVEVTEDGNGKGEDRGVGNGVRLRVAVLGTGQYSSAFAERVTRCGRGVEVVMGSRRGSADPDGFPMPCEVVSYEKAVMDADIVVLGVPFSAYAAVCDSLGDLLEGRIIVDVSNSPRRSPDRRWAKLLFGWSGATEPTPQSNAEQLQELLVERDIHGASVVKAFNDVSAYAMSQPLGKGGAGSKVCMLSGEDMHAKMEVATLARRMGLEMMDMGGIDAASTQETMVHRFFDGWKMAAGIGVVTSALFLLCNMFQYFIWGPMSWVLFPKKALLLVTGDVAAILLTLSFLPGPIAALWQLVRRTARRPFPRWFANWLGIRKQLGLLACLVCVPHVVIACMGDKETPEQIANQLAPVFGTLAFTAFIVIAICSSGPVSAQFSWSEFRFVFVWLGYTTVALTVGHLACLTAIAVADKPARPDCPPPTLVFVMSLMALSLLLKVLVSVPPIQTVVAQIRTQQSVSLLPKWAMADISFRNSSLASSPPNSGGVNAPAAELAAEGAEGGKGAGAPPAEV